MQQFKLNDGQAETPKTSLREYWLNGLRQLGKVSDLSYLLPFLRVYRGLFALSFAFFLVSMLSTLALPKIMAKLIDGLNLKQAGDFQFWLWVFLGLSFAKIFSGLLQQLIFINAGEKVQRDIRKKIHGLLQQFPLRFYDQNSSGRIISRSVNDVTNLGTFFSPQFYSMLGNAVTIVGAVAVFFSFSLPIGLGVSLLSIVLVVKFSQVLRDIGPLNRHERTLVSQLNSWAADTLSNLESVYADNYRQYFYGRYSRRSHQLCLLILKRISTWAKFPLGHAVALGAAYFLVIYYGVHLVQLGELSLGDFASMMIYLLLIFQPFMDFTQRVFEIQTSLSSLGKMRELFDLERASSTYHKSFPQHSRPKVTDHAPLLDLKVSGLSFAYEPGRWIFQGLDLTFPAHKMTAIIGKTGCGKTTLSGLICGLYPHQAGEITLWDQATGSSFSLEEQVGMISQQIFIFEDTLRENLRLYDQNISDEKIWEVLAMVGLEKAVRAMPEQLGIWVDRQTQVFSMGEKQLVMIARMLIKNPRILIFDEATAFLDYESEHQVQQAFKLLFSTRTTLVIAHRLNTILSADYVAVLDQGKLVEFGPKARLEHDSHSHFSRYLAYLKHEH